MDELRRRQAMARQMGGADKVKRQHDGGRLTVRERIDAAGRQGSFREIGSVAGKADYDGDDDLVDLMPANSVMGRGADRRPARRGRRRRLHRARRLGRRHDSRSRASSSSDGQRVSRAARAHDRGLGRRRLGEDDRDHRPRQRAGESAAGNGWSHNMGTVPSVALGLGSVAGLGAARLAASHYSVMVKEISAMFVAGPPVVNRLGAKTVRQAGAGRLGDPAARRRDRRGGRQRGRGVRCARAASSPTCPRRSTSCRRAGR